MLQQWFLCNEETGSVQDVCTSNDYRATFERKMTNVQWQRLQHCHDHYHLVLLIWQTYTAFCWHDIVVTLL